METKPWYTSRTIWGLIVTALSAVMQMSGRSLAPADVTALTDALGYAGEAVGLVVAAWGRAKADKPIGGGGSGAAAMCLLLILGGVLSAGCASNKTTTTIYGPDGKTPVQTIATDHSDAAMHNQARLQARLQAMATAKPIGRIVIPDGATLLAKGGDVVFEVNVPTPEHMVNWSQYKEPWLEAAQTAGGVLTTGILGYVLGFGDNYAQRGNGPVNYNVSASENSGVNAWSPNGVASPSTVTPAPVVVPPVVVSGE